MCAAIVGAGLLTGTAYAAPYEPNDTFSQATGPMQGGQDYAAAIENRGDQDWFYFNTVGQRQLDVSLTPKSTGCRLDMQTYNSSGQAINDGSAEAYWYTTSSPPAVGHAKFTSPGRRQYVVRIDLDSGASSGCVYALRVSPADAITTESPGMTMSLGVTDADVTQRVFVNGLLKIETSGRGGGEVSLGKLPSDARITYEAHNPAGGWEWTASLTNLDGRSEATLWSEDESGSATRVGLVRRAVISASGAVLEGCGETLAPTTCFPRDSDGDGVFDGADRCATTSGQPPTGCPDEDRDGIVDADDNCESTPGPASAAGCPDGDGDGFPDASDSCSALAGVAPSGCPVKSQFKTTVALGRRGSSYRGRVASPDVGCTAKRRVSLRRVGSGSRSFASAITRADGSFTLRPGRRLRGRVYVVVNGRSTKVKTCQAGSSSRIRG